MGFQTFGFGFGRQDIWEPEEVFWGPEDTWLGDERYSGDRELAGPFAAVQMGLIYVNPEGPNGNPDPLGRGPRHPRDVQPDGDERRGDRRPDRRRPHLRQDPRRRRRRPASVPSRRAAPLEEQGLGWKNAFGTGKGADAITSGLEVTWTPTPTQWDNELLRHPVRLRVGAHQEPRRCEPVGRQGRRGHRPRARRPRLDEAPPTMLTTDLSLRLDPEYEKISRRFHEDPDEFRLAFAKAWYKLLHRDMGPVARFLGPWVAEPQLWQDPVPAVDHELVVRRRRGRPQGQGPRQRAVRRPAGLVRRGPRPRRSAPPTSAAARTAPASASSRSAAGTVNDPAELATVLRGAREDPAGVQRRAAARRSRWPT